MYETETELWRLQIVIDKTLVGYRKNPPDFITGGQALTARQIARRLQGIQRITVATPTAGEPWAGRLDALFMHGRFHFIAVAGSYRIPIVRQNQPVTVTLEAGDDLTLWVFGNAILIGREHSAAAAVHAEFARSYGKRRHRLAQGVLFIQVKPSMMYAFVSPRDELSE